MTETGSTTQDALRDDILAMGHDDFVSMADVQSCICGGLLAELSAERQQLVVDTVRSLLEDGLVEVGVIPARNDPGFKPWPGTLDEVMTQFIARFVGRYFDERQWQYTIWLNLTAKGEQVSARRRVEAAVNGDLELRELSVEEGAVFNAEIAAAIQEKLAGSDYSALLAERGLTTMAPDENGDIV